MYKQMKIFKRENPGMENDFDDVFIHEDLLNWVLDDQ